MGVSGMVGDRGAAQDIDVDLAALFSGLARDWWRILIVAIVVAAAAFVLASLATPRYMGETRLLIETGESVFTRRENSRDSEQPILDREGVTSQVEVISSTDLIRQVAARLELASLPEFNKTASQSVIGRVLVLAGLGNNPAEIPPGERVIAEVRERLNVYRVENSRVIVIEFSSEDPELAAAVPNAIADAYIAVQREAKSQSNAAATGWLEPEIADLRQRVKEAERRVAEFRAQSDLPIGSNETVLSTQQLSELSTELSRVRASRSASEAKAQSLRAALAAGIALETLPDVLSSPLIQRLRERQVQLKAEAADLSTTLLENHPRLKSLRSQLSDLDSQIRAEADKVLQGLETEVKTAQFRERQLISDLNMLKAESARAGEEQVELRALEREAAAQRELLESYLTRYREALSRRERNYLPADARVFSLATAPSEPYFPKVVPIVMAAFAASTLLMAVLTLLRELFSGRAMRPAAGAPPVAVRALAMPAALAPDADPPASREPAPWSISNAAERVIAGGASRAIFISPEGDEAAAAAVLVAREVADAGLRTLLLDMTATGAASRPMLDGAVLPGITDLLASEARFTDIVHGDHYSDCHIIPIGTVDPVRAMRAAERLPIIMESLTTAYDVVIVECGPVDAEHVRRLASEDAEVMLSVIEPDDAAIAETLAKLTAGGYGGVIMVTSAGDHMPGSPLPDRTAA
jgi:exopolysaccharide transport family protein